MGNLPALKLGEYLLDKFEVTNREYKIFMDEGGYRRPEFWKQKLMRDGKEIPWEEAMKSFIDKTDRPGRRLGSSDSSPTARKIIRSAA